MLRDLFQKVLEVLVWLEIVCLGCLCNAVDYRTGLGSSDSINSIPVFLPETEGPDTPLRSLFKYQNKRRYAEDIFILIFCQGAHKHCIRLTKDENNRSTLTRRSGQTHLRCQAIWALQRLIPDCFYPWQLSAFPEKALHISVLFVLMNVPGFSIRVPVRCRSDINLLPSYDL